MGFGELAVASAARDVIEQIARGVLRSDRPEPFLAKVYDVDVGLQKGRVMAVGDTIDSLTPVTFGLDKIPSQVMADNVSLGADAPADVVRVMKMGGTYFIFDYVFGSPLPVVAKDADVLHENPSFENPRFFNGIPADWMFRDYLFSGAWSMKLDPKDAVHGNFSLQMFHPNPSAMRLIPEDASVVTAGDTIRVSCWAKQNPGSKLLSIGIYSGATAGAAQLFGGGTNQSKTFIPTDYWSKYTADFIVPAGHTFIRPEFLPWTIGSTDFTTWIDDTRTVRLVFVPWIAVDGSTSGGFGNLFTNGWVNFGVTEQTAQIRKVDDVVEVRGVIKSGTVGTSIMTLPLGYRPPADISFAQDSGAGHYRLVVKSDGTIGALYGGGGNAYLAINCRFSTI